jgi:hypothetical protein
MNWRLIGISKVKNDAIFTTNNQNAAHIAAGAPTAGFLAVLRAGRIFRGTHGARPVEPCAHPGGYRRGQDHPADAGNATIDQRLTVSTDRTASIPKWMGQWNWFGFWPGPPSASKTWWY